MKEKQTLIAIFEKIVPSRPSAQGILVLLKSGNIDQEVTHKLLEMISGYIENIEDENLKNAMIHLQTYIQKIHKEEAEDREKENEELEEILASLDNI